MVEGIIKSTVDQLNSNQVKSLVQEVQESKFYWKSAPNSERPFLERKAAKSIFDVLEADRLEQLMREVLRQQFTGETIPFQAESIVTEVSQRFREICFNQVNSV